MTDGFEKVYLNNLERLKRTAILILKNPEDAEDVVQKAFLNMLKNSVNVETLSEDEHLMYLYTSIRNISYDTYRSHRIETEKIEKLVKNTDALNVVREDDRTYLTAVDEVYSDLVKDRLESLEDLYREILYLNIFEGLTSNQIAKKLNLSNELVKKRIQRGKKKLRKLCDNLFDR